VTAEPAIETQGLTKRYGEVLALDSLQLTVRAGEVYGFLGPNGAGKTTTIRLLLGVHKPTAGRSMLFGVDSWSQPVRGHRRVAYVAGEPSLWPSLTAAETLEFLGRMHASVDRAYRDELVQRFDLDVRKRVRALSKGNRQKVQLVAALATRADLLLLDEPTSGLDPLMEIVFREAVTEAKARGQTVFLSSHILSEVEALCDRVGILRAGRMIDEGSISELRHLGALTVEATFEGEPPTIGELPGVGMARVGANALRFEVTGPVGPLISELGRHSVLSLTSRAPSLEEIFLHHYAADDDAAMATAAAADADAVSHDGERGDS
jgi:ABC-2 type transport system ATP-binding protein